MIRHWLKPRPLLVVLMLVAAPGAALAHLLIHWVPESLALRRLTTDVRERSDELQGQTVKLAELQAQAKEMRKLVNIQVDQLKTQWLEKRTQDEVSEIVANTLEGDGVQVDRISFGSPALFAADEQAGVLACEEVSVSCSGNYEGLVRGLDAFEQIALPYRITHMAWSCNRSSIQLTLDLQIPFVPDKELDKKLSMEAGFDEGGDDEL